MPDMAYKSFRICDWCPHMEYFLFAPLVDVSWLAFISCICFQSSSIVGCSKGCFVVLSKQPKCVSRKEISMLGILLLIYFPSLV